MNVKDAIARLEGELLDLERQAQPKQIEVIALHHELTSLLDRATYKRAALTELRAMKVTDD